MCGGGGEDLRSISIDVVLNSNAEEQQQKNALWPTYMQHAAAG